MPVAFTKDGLLDNECGVLFVRPGHAPPRVGDKLGRLRLDLVSVRPLGGPWYRFGTT